MKRLSFDVPGTPVPEGSVRVFPTKRGPRIVHDNAGLDGWRALVRDVAVLNARQQKWPLNYNGPVEVSAVFWLPRPKSVRAGLPAVKPDLDKLTRAVGDAITYDGRRWADGLIREDSRIVRWRVCKAYADDVHRPGVAVTIAQVDAAAVVESMVGGER